MSVEKMRLVKISGENEKLNDLVRVIMDCGCFQPDSANKFFSSSMGLLPYTEENQYAAKLSGLLTFTNQINYTPVFDESKAAEPLTEDELYKADRLHGISVDFSKQYNILLEQKQKCEEGLVKFSHFTGLSVDLDRILELEFVKARFGHLPKESLAKLDSLFKECPYFYFVPCSADKTDSWGVYFAPANRIDEVDKIFAMLLL